ncbi:hypothetical protein FHW84_002573 [Dyella sp. SG562]|jgi:hypothetical protein|uniref:hypothetical protein n=1 Tax=Dyella sp. SG562 TaxID=2587017 RepID=UPI00141DBCBF|nr:hypothetical protein [Dyella sp. SG562]NII73988.1 hypothetical protein [Dyella sp. SG562]
MPTFDKREIARAAEPVSSDELAIGDTYFSVTYADEDMKIPLMESMTFIGKNLGDHDETETLYFQDAESYREGIRLSDDPEPGSCNFFFCGPDQLDAIFDFERALEELMRCSLRRAAT